jgi:universal stress protein E
MVRAHRGPQIAGLSQLEDLTRMGSIRRILVAVKEPMARALPAVAKATQLARALDAQLELFHAIDNALYVDMLAMTGSALEPFEDEQRTQFLQRLGRIAARVRLHGVGVSTAVEWDYPVYEAIVRRAAAIGADLIVAERHAGRHIAPGFLGLADWELLRLSPVPVLLVKKSRPYHHPAVLAAVDPGLAFAKPAALDQEILRVATVVSDALRGKLHAVHACAPVPASLTALSAAAASRIVTVESARASSGFERLLRPTNIPAARRHLLGGDPCEAVRATAARLRSDIVVMGALSRSGLKRLLIGNTAERLLDRLPCDLLIVKPAEFTNRVPHGSRGPRVLAVQPLC